jgi:hypothetical protein
MALRLKLKLLMSLSSTTAEEKDHFNVDPGTSHEVSDAFLNGNSRHYRVADGTTDQSINFSGITSPQMVALLSDQLISIKLDGGSAIPIKKPSGWDYGYFLLTTDDLDTLTLSNASGYTANVKIFMVGDLA